MTESFTKSIQLIFNTSCLVASIGTISYCIYKYNLDEDSTSVDFKHFDQYNPDQGYPSFTICLLDPFLKDKLKSHGEGIDIPQYKEAAWGATWDPRINKIDYDIVTIDLNKNVIFRQEWNDQFQPITYNAKTKESTSNEVDKNPFYVSHRCPWGKCFSQDIPFGEEAGISKHDIWIDMNIFPNKTLPPGREEVDIWKFIGQSAFGIIFHSPNQLTRSIRLQSTTWDFDTEKSEAYKYHVLKFTVRSMQVLKRRNKRRNPCVEGRANDDEDFYQNVMKKVGCRPSFMVSSIPLPNCSSKEQLLNYNSQIAERMAQGAHDDGLTIQPCISLESLEYTYHYSGYSLGKIKNLYPEQEHLTESLSNVSSAIKLEFNFRLKRFQLMTKEQKYCLEALIGNAGNRK